MQTTTINPIEQTTKQLILKGISKGMSYLEFRSLIDELALNGKSTGPEQTEALANYTVLNQRRMKRLDKTLKISDEIATKIKNYNTKVTWLVLLESWCGDAAQTVPMMNKVAELNPNIELKLILRDANLDIMNRFLTNNAMSIPKMVMADTATGELLGEWGSRPSEAAQMVVDYKKNNAALTAEFKEQLQVWYNKDKGQNTLADLLRLLLK